MVERKRSKMLKEGLNPSEEEVCQAVLDSSFRANAGVTATATTMGEVGVTYHMEVAV
eukprot:CAMPEP_0197698562 /NCGR_PEP_ID=MMETSP1338-20131121/119503_1 /TAXON_ID=43686 ORGANISM="Pelagodinium beii, Strain RCC1491" /NCGR_SAMPLE_ID=MMETSP1338 /ASSEMBLY_ACC=CAM_ASM_000754 /LENGTH=56 /DNA_ID=CAMNT_0043281973 /DNA_START=149 /DNA_END=316 /DNA_ORIENTATION=-